MQKSHQLLVFLLILFGAGNTILLALQNHQKIPQLKDNPKFIHPFIQTGLMFLGQSLCFIPYIIYKLFRKQKSFLQKSGFMKKQCPIYLPLIPGIMDLLSSLLAYISLGLIAGSVWQISRGGVIITTVIFSRIFLTKKFTNFAILGCALAFFGITLVQIFQITMSQKNSDEQQHSTLEQIIGVILLLVSLIFNTIALITEKKLFNQYSIHPLKMVFLEGMFGFLGICIIIFILNFVPCPDVAGFKQRCILYEGKLYVQNVNVFFDQISRNTPLLMFCIGFLFSIGISVPIAVTISKLINPVSRSLADVCRTVIIWIFCLLLTITIGQNDNQYKLQQTGLLLNLLKMIGFIIVVLGTLIYHEIIKVFKQKPEDFIKQSMLLSEGALDIDKYDSTPTSSVQKISTPSKSKNQRQNVLLQSRQSLM